MLVHLAMMLSKVSGWGLPSDGKTHDSHLSSHESAIMGEVDGARDRRRLASSCNDGWSVCPPRLSFSPMPNRAAAFLLAATHKRVIIQLTVISVTAATAAATTLRMIQAHVDGKQMEIGGSATPNVIIRADGVGRRRRAATRAVTPA